LEITIDKIFITEMVQRFHVGRQIAIRKNSDFQIANLTKFFLACGLVRRGPHLIIASLSLSTYLDLGTYVPYFKKPTPQVPIPKVPRQPVFLKKFLPWLGSEPGISWVLLIFLITLQLSHRGSPVLRSGLKTYNCFFLRPVHVFLIRTSCLTER
jgi:hypothetical protein